MSRQSMMVESGNVIFPSFTGDQLYMHAFDFSSPKLPEGFSKWEEPFNALLSVLEKLKGKGYLTIDQSFVKKGESHRRPGKHVDGNYLFSWKGGGGDGWLTGNKGRKLSSEKHKKQYCSAKGGVIIASDFQACRAWNGIYEGDPNQGGDCSHINTSHMEELLLQPNVIYKGNHAIHESLPVVQDITRSLIRVTLPADVDVFTCLN